MTENPNSRRKRNLSDKRKKKTITKLDFVAPETATKSGKLYFDAEGQAFTLLIYVFDTAHYGDYAAFIAKEVLEGRPPPKGITPPELTRTNPGVLTQRFRTVSQSFLQMLICRFVDNFETYLTQLIREVFGARPEMLRSKEEVKLEYVLQFATMDELVVDLIDRKVNELGYRGIVELDKWFHERMGIALVENAKLKEALIEFIETRNIVVHNRGIVNSRYLGKVHNSSFAAGEPRSIDADYLFELLATLHSCAVSLDKRVGRKFGLEMRRFRYPTEKFEKEPLTINKHPRGKKRSKGQ